MVDRSDKKRREIRSGKSEEKVKIVTKWYYLLCVDFNKLGNTFQEGSTMDSSWKHIICALLFVAGFTFTTGQQSKNTIFNLVLRFFFLCDNF